MKGGVAQTPRKIKASRLAPEIVARLPSPRRIPDWPAARCRRPSESNVQMQEGRQGRARRVASPPQIDWRFAGTTTQGF